MESLSPRKERILKAVVLEYVETAEPVGSSLIVERYDLGVGPATVRNELADIAERGYLEQPHTSSGRIPSDSGYRYYVDRLTDADYVETSSTVRDINNVEELLADTCRILARVTQHVSVAATLRERSVTVRQVSLTSITPQRALMVVVFSNASVEDRLIESSPDLTAEDLARVAHVMTQASEGVKLKPLSRRSTPSNEDLKPSSQNLLSRAWRELRSLAKSKSEGKVISEGTAYLVNQPEFQRDYQALMEIVQALEDANVLQEAIEGPALSETGVAIGRENTAEALKRLAVIAARFYINGEDAGAIAVIGPTRMHYESTVPLVRQTARALTDALTRLSK